MADGANILVIGQGGREHVLAWKIHQSKRTKKVYCLPGNAGMAEFAECVDLNPIDFPKVIEFAKKNNVAFTVVGPEAPLAAGIVDAFKTAGLKIFGPDRYAAQLEGSKTFSKQIMIDLGIPTAEYHEFTDAKSALEHLKQCRYPVVIKADGLAAGKGVVIPTTREEAEAAIQDMMVKRTFGAAGDKVLIEEFLTGEEASLIAVADGETVVSMASSQDHKRIFDGDQGPNTGGMGAYSPAPVVTDAMLKEAEETIFRPVIRAMKKQGHPFVGFLYAGIMVTAQGMKVLEFNVRFGDPEAQAVLVRLDTDIVELFEACINGKLASLKIKWLPDPAVTVVLASHGYPASSRNNDVIQGLDKAKTLPKTQVFHAGTKSKDGKIVTAGGRVLTVTAFGPTVREAVNNAYKAVDCIRFDGMQYRKDIAHRALKTLAAAKK